MAAYKAVVIGGGPAGHTAAVRISELGGKVALIERDYIGGICTNWGCTPSKSMIESAKVAKTVAESGLYGVDVEKFHVDFARVAQRRDRVILDTRSFITDLLEHHNVVIFHGEGQMLSPGRVLVRKGHLDEDGETMHYEDGDVELETENIIIATGSKPLIPPFVDENDPSVVSSNRLISIGKLPESLTIVGGGVIGLEFATIFSNMGTKVTIIEFLDRVLAQMDPDISAEITRIMESRGVRVMTAHKCLSLEKGIVKVENMRTGEIIELEAPMSLIAIGRNAVVDEDSYRQLGIHFTRKGVEVDDYQRTSVQGIWSVGDATGRSILAHVGIQQGIVAAENIMNDGSRPLRKMDYSVIPAVIYTLPEIVGVGTVPENMEGVEMAKVPFAVNLRAGIEDFKDGFIKIWIRDYKILAAQAIGHNVSEIMQEVANMIALGTDVRAVSEIIHAHPTYSEIIRSTLDYAMDKAVDFYL